MYFREEGIGGGYMISSYGDGGFRVGETRFDGGLLIAQAVAEDWKCKEMVNAGAEGLSALLNITPTLEVIIFGSGADIAPLPAELKAQLTSRKIAFDVMGTGAAARTYNVLQSEGRRVGAALIAID